MPAYLYWGEDDYRLSQAVQTLVDQVIDPAWRSFNLDHIEILKGPDASTQIIQGLTQAMTPPFGFGNRLVWLNNPPLGGQGSDTVVTELERTLPALPETSYLLLTSSTKPDGRSKITKLLSKYATVKEFSLIPPWKTDLLLKAVRQAADHLEIQLTPDAIEHLADCVGNDTRQLYSELKKLKLYTLTSGNSSPAPQVTAATVMQLVSTTTQNTLHLADEIRQGHTSQALTVLSELVNQNEPGLKIVATLIRQFRTWLWLKLMLEEGERDQRTIARAAEIKNPKRIYFLQQDVQSLKVSQLQSTLSHLLDLDVSLKQGCDATATLQTKVIELCQLCSGNTAS